MTQVEQSGHRRSLHSARSPTVCLPYLATACSAESGPRKQFRWNNSYQQRQKQCEKVGGGGNG